MEGGARRKDGFPIGFRFKPRDVELVEYYLLPRLQGRRTVPNDAVVEANVYACHPETLTNEHRCGGPEEWYFLSPRARRYGNGVRPARKTLDGRGRWKASTATKEVAQEVVCDGIKFCKNVLNYFGGTPKKEARTKWIMLELTVPEYETKLDKPGPKNMLEEFVMCKIYVSPLHKRKGDADDDEEGASSSACEEDDEACSSTQHSQVTAESSLSEKQAGKRPMAEQPPVLLGPAPKQARYGGSLSIGSTQASLMQQRPAGAYYGQAPTPMPAQYQPFSHPYNEPFGLMQHPTPVQFSDPVDEAFGLTAATMTRPPNPGYQAATARRPCFPGNPQPRPPVSAQCYYEQNYRAVHPSSQSQLQRPPALQPRQRMQQPVLNGGGTGAVSRGPSRNSYPYQSSSLTPAANGHGGPETEEVVIVNAEEYFTELATCNPSFVVGAMQPEPFETPAPAAAGAARVKTSGLNTQDAA